MHIFFVDRLVDIVAEYAPLMCGRCLKTVPQRVAVFCRCMFFQYGGADHRVVRRLRSDREVLRGNHWVIGAPLDTPAEVHSIPPHAPCSGSQRGRPGGACMSPLLEDLLSFGILALPTAEQGDCCLDVMVYWDGRNRAAAQWQTPCSELAVASEAVATDA